MKTVEKTPAKTGMTFDVTTITPTIAAAWLDKNTGNRKLSQNYVKAYARDMVEGRWQLTGDAIRFSETGRLIDGQHRLAACIAADVPFQSIVAYNLPDSAQNVIDTNKSRSVADVLALNGNRYSIKLAPAARLLLEIERGTTAPLANSRRSRFTHAEIMDVVRRHPKLVASCAVVGDGKITGAHMISLIVIHYIAVHFLDNVEDAGNFVYVFKTGIPRYTGDAAHATRERLLRAKNETHPILPTHQCMLMIQAWNNFAARRQVQQVKIPSSITIMGLDRNKLRKGTA